MFFGVVEFSAGCGQSQDLDGAEELADLGGISSIDDTEIDNFFKIARAVITPYSRLCQAHHHRNISTPQRSRAAQWSKGMRFDSLVRIALYRPILMPETARTIYLTINI